ncbi:unnamed protein product [Vitrella brassicaformis CCMP3155]|uniref:2'-phosphotransferase n=2 Tax=Vitrella brassicaformis TaxID=1169539 RepID=A0A0G4F3X2_VITBC|nr:unnamed protein product [Vitrella brassicaformis CCMP3155]|eukprot:CEM06704.1 unnamed protein product [Vitrella brassicaformis CCMP3155]
MKFGKRIREAARKSSGHYYIDYKSLKRLVKRIRTAVESELLTQTCEAPSDPSAAMHPEGGHTLNEAFEQQLELEIQKVEDDFRRALSALQARYDRLKARLDQLHADSNCLPPHNHTGSSSSSDTTAPPQAQLSTEVVGDFDQFLSLLTTSGYPQWCLDLFGEIRDLSRAFDQLRKAVVWNSIAVAKILKKRRKNTPYGHTRQASYYLLTREFYTGPQLAALVTGLDCMVEEVMLLVTGRPINRDSYECPICYETLKSPVVLPCSHRFCLRCLAKAAESFEACPLCRRYIEPELVTVDEGLERFVKRHFLAHTHIQLPPPRAVRQSAATRAFESISWVPSFIVMAVVRVLSFIMARLLIAPLTALIAMRPWHHQQRPADIDPAKQDRGDAETEIGPPVRLAAHRPSPLTLPKAAVADGGNERLVREWRVAESPSPPRYAHRHDNRTGQRVSWKSDENEPTTPPSSHSPPILIHRCTSGREGGEPTSARSADPHEGVSSPSEKLRWFVSRQGLEKRGLRRYHTNPESAKVRVPEGLAASDGGVSPKYVSSATPLMEDSAQPWSPSTPTEQSPRRMVHRSACHLLPPTHPSVHSETDTYHSCLSASPSIHSNHSHHHHQPAIISCVSSVASMDGEWPEGLPWPPVEGCVTSDQQYAIIKRLNYILRHGAPHLGLPMREDGYVRVCELLALEEMQGVTTEIMQEVVKTCHKRRYEVREDAHEGPLIRATQGHTIRQLRTDRALQKIISPEEIPVCVHGTYMRNWLGIRLLGLHRMSRNHIHFAPGLLDAREVISGMRRSSEVAIYINTHQAMHDGITFFRSSNNVILTEGLQGALPPRYFSTVRQLQWDVDLWRDGVDLTEQYLDRLSGDGGGVQPHDGGHGHGLPASLPPAEEVFVSQLKQEVESVHSSPFNPGFIAVVNSSLAKEVDELVPLDDD